MMFSVAMPVTARVLFSGPSPYRSPVQRQGALFRAAMFGLLVGAGIAPMTGG
jgi:hypothetical protein